jgi:1-acyl-sn-glycerol-3-phosphate acyltransferase
MAANTPDLFEMNALTPGVLNLLGPELSRVVAAAVSGDRQRLHVAERAWADAASDELSIDISVSGLEHVETSRSYVVAPLHEGFADVLALLRLPLALTWVIRDELLELPYFGRYLQTAGHIAVEPESPRAALRRILAGARSAMSSGESLVVFPQGSVLGLDIAFQPGAFRVAEHFDVPVLPVVLTGSHRVWDYPFSAELRSNQKIRMEVLRPIDPTEGVAQMHRLERRMKRLALRVSDAPARRYVPARDGEWPNHTFAIDPNLEPAAAERI